MSHLFAPTLLISTVNYIPNLPLKRLTLTSTCFILYHWLLTCNIYFSLVPLTYHLNKNLLYSSILEINTSLTHVALKKVWVRTFSIYASECFKNQKKIVFCNVLTSQNALPSQLGKCHKRIEARRPKWVQANLRTKFRGAKSDVNKIFLPNFFTANRCTYSWVFKRNVFFSSACASLDNWAQYFPTHMLFSNCISDFSNDVLLKPCSNGVWEKEPRSNEPKPDCTHTRRKRSSKCYILFKVTFSHKPQHFLFFVKQTLVTRAG